MYSTSWDPTFNSKTAFERQQNLKLLNFLKPILLSDTLYIYLQIQLEIVVKYGVML